MESDSFRYDVALSFAGENRDYVEHLASHLRARGIRVFYDKYEQPILWGKNLYTHLSDVYRKQAKYTVIFISEHYARKVWTNHERESAQARALTENEEYILPVRFDDTELPGLLPTVAYIDARTTTPISLADTVAEKLRLAGHQEDQRDEADPGGLNRRGWQRYENRRFGFGIRFPMDWGRSHHPENSDGITIHPWGNEGRISVSAGFHFLDFEDMWNDLPGERSRIRLYTGAEADFLVHRGETDVTLRIRLISGRVEYNFVAKASTQSYFGYEDLLLDVGKSLYLISGSDRSSAYPG